MNAPSGIVSFLFTDIEGSTRRWEADPDAMQAALEKHDEVLRRAVTDYGGSLFKHTGDGVCAAFSSPSAAVDAAVAAQRALQLPVRMSIATGEAERRGGDYFGAVLNRAARVMSAGHGGQILLDGATAALITGIDLMSLGPRRLRDIAKPVDVFQIRADGLRTEFPPLKTADRVPGNLRPRNTSFIGRETELAELDEVLKVNRLVTLTGVGGVGKTRLALEAGGRLADSFPEGVWVIELAAVGDPDAVPDAVAAVLGITQQPGMSLSDSVAAALEGRSRLLIVDNCEHVLDAAAALIEAILARSETVKILATSREGLRIEGEQPWPVPSLDVNSGLESSAASLFVDRARIVARGVSLTPQSAVVEICQRLDGIPLAIELAASRMQSMTVAELRDRLDDRFRLLVGSRRGLERHQTLRHAVQWSYDLLDVDEKALLNRCSVFAGGFDLAAGCAVAGSDDEIATLDLLDALVRKSLLVADRSGSQTRFSMLETIRQFAEEQLVHAGEGDEVRTTHAHYFARCEADVLLLWDSPRQREAYVWFALELANLRAAFRWSADRNDIDTAAAIAFIASFLGFWVEQFEPVVWAEELIEPARAVNHRRLAQLYAMATQCYAVGRLDDSFGYAEAGLLAIDSGRFDPVPYAFESWMGGPYIWTGALDKWLGLCRNMIVQGRGTHCFTQTNLVIALTFTGSVDDALAASENLVATADATDNPAVICYALIAYGYPRRDTDPAAAYEGFRRGLTLAQDSGNRQLESHLAGNASFVAGFHGDAVDAFDLLATAIRNHYDSGSFSLMLTPLAILATVLDRLGRYEPAAKVSGFAGTPFTRASFPEMHILINHLREVLGEDAYEAFARVGAGMSPGAMAAFALEQIDIARADLVHAGEAP
jgi:predicted ATPase